MLELLNDPWRISAPTWGEVAVRAQMAPASLQNAFEFGAVVGGGGDFVPVRLVGDACHREPVDVADAGVEVDPVGRPAACPHPAW